MKPSFTITLFVTIALLLAACRTSPAEPASQTISPSQTAPARTPTTEPNLTETPKGGLATGQDAIVENLEVMILESFPVQVNVVVRGSLPDGCTTIQTITTSRESDRFDLTILTQRPIGAECTEALVPFEETVSLDVFGLPAGTYTVKAADQTASFQLDVDNLPQEVKSCPKPGEDQKLFRDDVAVVPYCFLYPADFEPLSGEMEGFHTLVGPKHGDEPEPMRATLSIATFDPAGRTLEGFVDTKVAEYPGLTIQQESIDLGDVPAILLPEFPGRLPASMVYAEKGGRVYELTFWPDDPAAPEARADMRRLFEIVVRSWVFLD
jgi:hypothetical protein